MATISGYYINLESSKERRKKCERQLKELGLESRYQRFNAIKGEEKNIDGRRILNEGEDGIWQSWIKLLTNELNKEDKERSDYLHIMEDDAILTREFVRFTKAISNKEPEYDLLATEMYINPSLYNYYFEYFEHCRSKKAIFLLKQEFSGCLSSILVHKKKVNKLRNILLNAYTK